MKRTTHAVIVILMLLLMGAIYSLQLRLDTTKGENAAEEFMYLPKAEYLKVASLGYEDILADFLWLKAIQHIGEKKISSKGYDWIYTALDTVTTLDPKFIEPYEAGGLILTVLAGKVDLSNKLLIKGVKYNPEVWQFPFYLGFNHFFFKKDYKLAAFYMEKAARIPGSPKYFPLLASRLYVQAEDPAYAISFLQGMYENTKDEKIRAKLLDRINVLRAVVTAKELQKAVDTYKSKFGKTPSGLKELVYAGIINNVPEEPNGGYYFIAPDGSVKSSKATGTIGIYTNPRQK